MYLSIIIPAKNEEKNIAKTIESVFAYCSGKSIEHEIIAVVNNATDGTAGVVRQLMPKIPSLRIIEFTEHRWPNVKGLAVTRGMLEANGQFRVFMDADNSTTIDTIEKMMLYFQKGYGVVVASIALPGARVDTGSEPLWRRAFGKLGNLYIQLFAVPGIWDTQRGFKMITGEAAEKVFSRMTIAGWGFDVEMLAIARHLGYKIKEVPIHWHNDPNSHVGLSAYAQVLRETLTVSKNLLTGRYR